MGEKKKFMKNYHELKFIGQHVDKRGKDKICQTLTLTNFYVQMKNGLVSRGKLYEYLIIILMLKNPSWNNLIGPDDVFLFSFAINALLEINNLSKKI